MFERTLAIWEHTGGNLGACSNVHMAILIHPETGTVTFYGLHHLMMVLDKLKDLSYASYTAYCLLYPAFCLLYPASNLLPPFSCLLSLPSVSYPVPTLTLLYFSCSGEVAKSVCERLVVTWRDGGWRGAANGSPIHCWDANVISFCLPGYSPPVHLQYPCHWGYQSTGKTWGRAAGSSGLGNNGSLAPPPPAW